MERGGVYVYGARIPNAVKLDLNERVSFCLWFVVFDVLCAWWVCSAQWLDSILKSLQSLLVKLIRCQAQTGWRQETFGGIKRAT
jgi:hypothetical protein